MNEKRAELVQKIEEEKAAAKEQEAPVEQHQSPPASGKGKKKPGTAKGCVVQGSLIHCLQRQI